MSGYTVSEVLYEQQQKKKHEQSVNLFIVARLRLKLKRWPVIHLSQLQNGRLFKFSISAKLCSKGINGWGTALMLSKVIKNYLTYILVQMVRSQRPIAKRSWEYAGALPVT